MVALVTGSAKGIGKELIIEFAKKGYDVIITYNTSKNEALNLQNYIIENYNVKVLNIKCDITNEKEEITSGKLYEAYSEVSKKDAVTYRRIFDFINELEMLGIISTNTISRGRGKGRTNIIKLQCDEDLLESSLYSSI